MKATRSQFDYRPLIAVTVIAITFIALVSYSGLTAPPSPPDQVALVITGPNRFNFSPNTLTIKAGDSVTWVNVLFFPYSVISDNDSVPFNSGSIAVGSSFVHTFNIPGTYPYHSDIPNANGTVIVEP